MASFHVTSLISVCHLRLSFSEEIQYGIQGLAELPGGFFRCLSASSSSLNQKAELEGCVRLGGEPWGWVMREGTGGRTDGTCKYSGILAKWDSDAAPLVLGVCACTRVHMWVCVTGPPGTRENYSDKKAFGNILHHMSFSLLLLVGHYLILHADDKLPWPRCF